jgi:predicted enzyme related to lactoylglutathione lyase
MIAVKKLAMMIVMENDLQVAVEFYQKLGLELVFHVPHRWAEFKINDLQIGLCPTDEKVQLNRTGIVFEVEDLNTFYQERKDTITFLDKPSEAAHGIMASIQDPSGNILDLYQPTPEKIKELAEKLKKEDECCGPKGCSPEQMQDEQGCCSDEQNPEQCC